MKKRFFSLLLFITFIISGCYNHEENESMKIINAENMEGIRIEAEAKSISDNEFEISLYDAENIRSTISETSEITTAGIPVFTAPPVENEISAESKTEQTSTAEKTEQTTTPKTSQTTTSISITTPQTTTTTIQTTSVETIITTEYTTLTENITNSLENNSDYKPLNYKNTVGVWISYIELSSILKGKNEDSFRKSFSDMMDNCNALGINTVFVHLRPFGDAFYESELFPWSSYVTGTSGKSPGFDPLLIMLEEAHSRDISFHGWINPMRINSASEIGTVGKEYSTGEWFNGVKKGDYIVKSGDYWYLNPAYDSVIDLIAGGAYEIVNKYEVDGIHIDDYFYPTTDISFDKTAFEKNKLSDLNDFRFKNISRMVKSIYNAVKKANPKVLFGISPQGSVNNNYNYLYADVKLWCGTNGYCDYIAPQIYYGFNNSSQPFKNCLAEWHEMASGSTVKIIPGLAAYKIGKEDVWAGSTGKNEWINNNDMLKRQIEEARNYMAYSGIVFYSYNYLFGKEYVTQAHTAEIDAMLHLLK